MSEFEIRKAGMVLASTSGPRDDAYRDAMHYYWQYVEEATEDEPVELVEIHIMMTAYGPPVKEE